jgi:glycosyltransferase involved in cell wall biosynthesis
VLHVARDWVRPSEGFVADVVAGSTMTRPVVAYGHRGTLPVPRVPSYAVGQVPGGDRAVRTAMAAVALRHRCAVLHGHFGYWASHVEAVARRTRRPWGLSLHGHDLLVEGCPVAVSAGLVVVPSRFLADVASRAGVRDEVLRVIPVGVDLTRHPFRERSVVPGRLPVVTFAGRYVEKKGVLDAARALAGIEGVTVRFVGHGPMEDELRRVLSELGLEAELRDGSTRGALHQALAETDLLVTASKVASDGDAETLGLVNLEALAHGVPVVTTSSGGIPEAMDPSAAVLVPEGDVAALRAAVQDLLAHPERWPEMGRRGRDHVTRRYALADRVRELEEHWIALAAGAPLPPAAR